jgi:hypothetical protein
VEIECCIRHYDVCVAHEIFLGSHQTQARITRKFNATLSLNLQSIQLYNASFIIIMNSVRLAATVSLHRNRIKDMINVEESRESRWGKDWYLIDAEGSPSSYLFSKEGSIFLASSSQILKLLRSDMLIYVCCWPYLQHM